MWMFSWSVPVTHGLCQVSSVFCPLRNTSGFFIPSPCFELWLLSSHNFSHLHYKSLMFPKLALHSPSFYHFPHLCFLIFCYCWVNSHSQWELWRVRGDQCESDAGIRNETFPHTPWAVRQCSTSASCCAKNILETFVWCKSSDKKYKISSRSFLTLS